MEGVAQTATEIAAQTGRLDFLSATLAIFTAFLAVAAFTSFWIFRSVVKQVSEETAKAEARQAVENYLSEHGRSLIKEALDDAEVVARLQIELRKLGLDDSDEAGVVDDDPDWVPEDDNERD